MVVYWMARLGRAAVEGLVFIFLDCGIIYIFVFF